MEHNSTERMSINYFDKNLREEENILEYLQNQFQSLANTYFGGIEIVPIYFENLEDTEAELNQAYGCILLNRKNKRNKKKLLRSLIHEIEHLYQIHYVNTYSTPKARRWKQQLENYTSNEDYLSYAIQEIEIDAEAMAQIILKCEYGLQCKNSIPLVQMVIDHYIKTKKILNDD